MASILLHPHSTAPLCQDKVEDGGASRGGQGGHAAPCPSYSQDCGGYLGLSCLPSVEPWSRGPRPRLWSRRPPGSPSRVRPHRCWCSVCTPSCSSVFTSSPSFLIHLACPALLRSYAKISQRSTSSDQAGYWEWLVVMRKRQGAS